MVKPVPDVWLRIGSACLTGKLAGPAPLSLLASLPLPLQGCPGAGAPAEAWTPTPTPAWLPPGQNPAPWARVLGSPTGGNHGAPEEELVKTESRDAKSTSPAATELWGLISESSMDAKSVKIIP